MEKQTKENFINAGLFIAFAIPCWIVMKDIFKDSLLIAWVIKIIGFAGFLLIWFLRKKNLLLRITVVLIAISAMVFTAKMIKEDVITDKPVKTVDTKYFSGHWVTMNQNLVLTLDINDTLMKMTLMPDNKEVEYAYRVQGDSAGFYNAKQDDSFQWKFLKLTDDSMVVYGEKTIYRFARK